MYCTHKNPTVKMADFSPSTGPSLILISFAGASVGFQWTAARPKKAVLHEDLRLSEYRAQLRLGHAQARVSRVDRTDPILLVIQSVGTKLRGVSGRCF